MPNLTILHISDLHRDPHNPLRNGVLISSLENDRRRYSSGATAIRPPDIAIVSGDIIQGVLPPAPDANSALRAQHAEALEFLSQLCDRFFNGDRNRVVLVPGNHDISATHFLGSLTQVDIAPDKKKHLISALLSPESSLRWSWADLALFQIQDRAKYASRLEPFALFYSDFYRGARTFALEEEQQFDIFDYPDFAISIVGLSSCHNNDLFNTAGAISPQCLASSCTRLRDLRLDDRVHIAVWHHHTSGLPNRSNYMDADILQSLIDCGFSLGFHGHQHRPQYLDTRFHYGANRRITVISAGTLCGGAAFRYTRAYNLVELDTEQRTGRLHVRAMQNDNLLSPIWGPAPASPGVAAFLDFQYDPPLPPIARPSESTALLLRAQELIETNALDDAVALLRTLSSRDDIARPLLLECLGRKRDAAAIIQHFDPPSSEAEVIPVADALWQEGKRDRLRALLSSPLVATSDDPSILEIRRKFAARLGP